MKWIVSKLISGIWNEVSLCYLNGDMCPTRNCSTTNIHLYLCSVWLGLLSECSISWTLYSDVSSSSRIPCLAVYCIVLVSFSLQLIFTYSEPHLQRRRRTNRLIGADVASPFVQSQILGTC
jgi:hypothetical protein